MKITADKTHKIAKKLKIDTTKIPLNELKKGLKTEKEHGPKSKGGVSNKTNVTKGSLKKTAKIAEAHLMESPEYYNELAKMEKKLERKGKSGKKMSKRKKSKSK